MREREAAIAGEVAAATGAGIIGGRPSGPVSSKWLIFDGFGPDASPSIDLRSIGLVPVLVWPSILPAELTLRSSMILSSRLVVSSITVAFAWSLRKVSRIARIVSAFRPCGSVTSDIPLIITAWNSRYAPPTALITSFDILCLNACLTSKSLMADSKHARREGAYRSFLRRRYGR